MRARDRSRAAARGRSPHSSPRRGSRGSSSVEYGLIIALIGAVLCIGIGVTVKSVFQDTIACFLANMQGDPAPSCSGATGSPGSGGSGDTGQVGSPVGTLAGTPSPTSSDTATTSDTPTASDTATPSDTPTPTP